MENASKALIIAASLLLGLMIISVCIFVFNQISTYYETKESNRLTEQLATFNSQYLVYQKNNLRGSDLLSLINKILDFNTLKGDEDPEIEISIKIGNSAEAEDIYYQYSSYNYGSNNNVTLIKINNTYTQNNVGNILREANRIETKYTKEAAEKLAATLSTLLGQNSSKTRNELLAELKINSVNDNEILKYYQYQQFKRARFKCKIVNFTETGRVQKFEVEFINKFE